MVASSSSVNCSRARCATQRTSSAVSAMTRLLLALDHAERLAPLGALDAAAANALHADAQALDAAADLALDVLQVRHELALARAGDFRADAAEVPRLAAVRLLIADGRLLAANGTL